MSQWCHPTISSSVIPLYSYLQCFPASGSFPMSPLLASGGQSIGASASASILPMNIQDWFPLALTGLISLLSKEPSTVFSNTTVQKHSPPPSVGRFSSSLFPLLAGSLGNHPSQVSWALVKLGCGKTPGAQGSGSVCAQIKIQPLKSCSSHNGAARAWVGMNRDFFGPGTF